MSRLNSPFLAGCRTVLPFTLAQEPPPAQEFPTFRAETNLVVLNASVVDKNGKLLTNIPQAAFQVFENGIEQPLKIFRQEDVPVSMGIIIDNSGSMRGKRESVAAAAMDLVKASNPQDEMFIVNFNDDVYLDQPFTSDSKKLEEALDKINSQGGTAMRDAISMSIDYLKAKGKKDKKVLLVVTDGNDNTSNISLEQLLRQARQNGVLIYSIGLLNEEEPREANKAKRALEGACRGFRRNGVFPETPGRSRQDHPTGSARDPQSVHLGVSANQRELRRELPENQRDGERLRQSPGENSERILRDREHREGNFRQDGPQTVIRGTLSVARKKSTYGTKQSVK